MDVYRLEAILRVLIMSPASNLVLAKFGRPWSMRMLLTKGEIPMNPCYLYTEIESGIREGMPGSIAISEKVPESGAILERDLEPIPLKDELRHLFPVYCMSALAVQDGMVWDVDARMRIDATHGHTQAGGAMVIITDYLEFRRRLRQGIAEAHFKPEALVCGQVSYVDASSHPVDIYTKSQKYSYQREFRFTLRYPYGRTCTLRLGSLEGIARLFLLP